MPELEAHLHYRIIDVSSIKELSRAGTRGRYFNSPQEAGGHRALADIRESIAELRYYREAVFVPLPGPDSEAAKAIAARHEIARRHRPEGAPGWPAAGTTSARTLGSPSAGGRSAWWV